MILVTGGAGFIGSVLVKELNKAGFYDIVIIDRLRTTEKWLNLKGLKYLEYHHSDFLFEYDYLFSNLQAIFHMGACSATTEQDMDYLMLNNVEYSKNLFKIATDKDIPLIYASSAATYGAGEHGYSDDHARVSQLSPLNRYGYSKQLVDEWVLKQRNAPKRWFGLKFFNVYGPNEYHKGEMRSLVHKAFNQIKETGKVRLFKSHRDDFKDGQQLRDFVYVTDVCKAMVKLLEVTDQSKSGIYNMGCGQARSFYDLTAATFQGMNKEVNVEFIDMPMEIRNQYQYYTQAEMGKFSALFPQFKFTSLEDGVGDYVKNYLMTDNPYY